MNISERLRAARERAKLSVAEVSGRLKLNMAYMSRQAIHRREQGKCEPSISELAALARVYQREVSWFLEEGEPPPDPQVVWCKP